MAELRCAALEVVRAAMGAEAELARVQIDGAAPCVVMVTQPGHPEAPLAIAGGADEREALLMLIEVVSRGHSRSEVTLTTGEVARVAGVSPSAIRHALIDGKIGADRLGSSGNSAEFTPAEVYSYLTTRLPRSGPRRPSDPRVTWRARARESEESG